ncbi:MAG TPA: sn-glycerol-3-phosphate ABC transporter ATP-binding protein UgpC [Devosiaceae bacterium]|nr:sn-glycerol-3-phosphate ABC transporter ATP-binding protein UgpC [Devosiaceae bacterium]
MASVEIRNIEKRFANISVIQGINVDIADHEFVVLVGPSGCGKSTLLRMIAGLEPISSGEIAIGGRVINNVAPRDRDIAMVFQNYALYPHMSVFDNMAFSLKLRRQPPEEIKRKVAEAADILNLGSYLNRSPRQLSGGQRQRVAMGRALVRDAQVFLYDEPLSNLDAKLRVLMRTEIKSLHQRLGTTSVYVTHDQIEAMTMADRIVVMQSGRIEQVGSPLELYDEPANLFVAGFIGSPSMNFVSGTVERTGPRRTLVASDGTRLLLPEGRGMPDQSVVLGIRPEHLRLAAPGDGLAAVVEVVEPTGPNIEVITSVAGARFCAVFNDRHPFRPGETIYLAPQPDKIHLFDATSGRRLV